MPPPNAAPGRPVTEYFDPPQAAGEVGRFAKYRVLKQLGEGGMGAVFLAEDGVLGRSVALKFMAPRLASDAAARERFLREAQAAARIDSEHVVKVYDVNDLAGVPYIAMERLKGQSLDDFLEKKGPPALAQSVRIAREAADGLAAAHAAGLIHRDIKPANIWLEAPRGKVRLIDFGLAFQERQDTRLTVSGQLVGTPEYMAPEQAAGKPVDARADLFSLGVTLYRLATGRRPFGRATVMASLAAVLTENPPPPAAVNPQVPQPLNDLILALLAKDPAGRPPTAVAVAQALDWVAAELARPQSFAVTAVPMYAAPAPEPQSQSWPVPVSDHAVPTYAPGDTEEAFAPARRRRSSGSPILPLAMAGAVVAGGLVLAALFALGVVGGGLRGKPSAKATPTVAPDPTPTRPATPALPPPPRTTGATPPATAAGSPPAPLVAPFSAAEARAAQQAWAKHLGRSATEFVTLPFGVRMELVLVPPGTFEMGSPLAEAGRGPLEDRHTVTLTRPFLLGKFEVTQDEFRAVVGSLPRVASSRRQPADGLCWNDADDFCKKLAALGTPARLPTEAEWEWACRAGTPTPFSFGPELNGSEANCNGTLPYGAVAPGAFLDRTADVGSYPANPFGLHDMHGNAWEFCQDYYAAYPAGPVSDPAQRTPGNPAGIVLRGGAFGTPASSCRSAHRNWGWPNGRHPHNGMRVCVAIPDPSDPPKPAPPAAGPPPVAVTPPVAPPTPAPPDLPRTRWVVAGEPFGHRMGTVKPLLLDDTGGTPQTEAAVARGLAFLARQQRPDGSWQFDGTMKTASVAATGLAVLAFLGAGETHTGTGKYRQVVAAGVRSLRTAQQGNGLFGTGTGVTMYVHGIGALALVEAYVMTRDPQLKAPAQRAVDGLIAAQGPNGSWGYTSGTNGDTSIVGWQLQALYAATLTPDLAVPPNVPRKAVGFLDGVSGGANKSTYGYTAGPGASGTSLSAIGLLSRYNFDGWTPANAGFAAGAKALVAGRLPKAGTKPDLYFLYYATQVVRLNGGDDWHQTWNPALRAVLTGDQEAAGSWPPDGGFIGSSCGRVGSTALAVLTLETYYRYPPRHDWR